MIKSENDIEDIVEGCRRGDRRAQEKLYKDFYRSMVSLCLRYTGNDQEAVEVLNNGFLKIFKYINGYDSRKGSIYTWIRTAMINSCIDHLKSRQKEWVVIEQDEEMEEGFEPEVISRMDAAALMQFIQTLPPSTKVVFNLYVIEGYAHKEIGEMMNISAGTSKWHLSEARRILQKKIKSTQYKIYE